MAENITRCPKCKTSFRISEAHLKSAKGAVRCGSCLNIFNAKENLITVKKDTKKEDIKKDSPVATQKPAITTSPAAQKPPVAASKASIAPALAAKANKLATSTTAKKPEAKKSPLGVGQTASSSAKRQKPPADDDDLLISDDMDAPEKPKESKYSENVYANDENTSTLEFSDTFRDLSNTGKFKINLFERDYSDDDDENAADSDESWALDLLEEDSDTTPEAPTQKEIDEEEERRITQEFEASFNFHKNDLPEDDDYSISDEELDYEEDKEEINMGSMYAENNEIDLDEDDHDEGYDVSYEEDKKEVSINKNDFSDNYQDDYREEEDTANDFYEDEDSYTDDGYRDAIYPEDDYREEEAFETSSSNYLDAIEPEPVEFAWRRHSSFWQSNMLWGTLSIAAAVALFAQIAIIKFDSLSVIEPYRSYYGRACEYLDCKLPELVNRNKIRTANLVVRSHPNVKDALIVDAVLQNTAKFEQTFPTLDLVFTDTQEKAVAARRLAPKEYLSGELAGRTHMPVKQPVHIAIEISDPGPEAVGYKISIVD